MGAFCEEVTVCHFVINANFQGLLSAVQPFSHPLTQLPLIIGLPCETYNRVSQGKLFLSPFFKQRTSRYRAQGISDLHKHRPITWVKRSNVGRFFFSEKIRWSGRDSNPGPLIPESLVLPLDHRPRNMSTVYFGFEDIVLVLIVTVPGHCLLYLHIV